MTSLEKPERARVIAFVGESRREKIIFDGLPEDAQQYIEQRFPRLHVEPGADYGESGPTADAVMDVNGTRTFFDGKNWADWVAPSAVVNTGPDDRDARIAELELQLQAAQAAPQAQAPQSEEAATIANLEARLRAMEDRKRIAELERQIAAGEAELDGGAPADPENGARLPEPSTAVGVDTEPPAEPVTE